MRSRLALLLVLAPLAAIALAQDTASTGPGSPAPPLTVTRWVSGTPVGALAKGRTYVIELFQIDAEGSRSRVLTQSAENAATSLTAVAKAHPEATVLGVGGWLWRPLGAGEPDLAGFAARLGERLG